MICLCHLCEKVVVLKVEHNVCYILTIFMPTVGKFVDTENKLAVGVMGFSCPSCLSYPVK